MSEASTSPRRGRLEVHGLSGRWGRFRLGPIDLTVEPSEYLVVLGRSGCGKTSLLETICGLRVARDGRVIIDGRDVAGCDPADRRIGFVPQDYALFPTMGVANNLAYALRARGVRRRVRESSARRIAELLGISHLLQRSTERLSGGEKQRVALGRALAAEPSLLLLDEPVSALDETTRRQVCAELASLQGRLGLTVVHVCHNLEEMWSVAHRVAVMDDGRLHQCGAPEQLCQAPATAAVAQALGLGAILPIEHVNGQAFCRVGRTSIAWPEANPNADAALLRPESVVVQSGADGAPDVRTKSPGDVRLSGVAVAVLPRGDGRIVRVDVGDIIDAVTHDASIDRGHSVHVQFATRVIEPLGTSA